MRIGILGSGLVGGKLGRLFARAGHEVVFSYARSDQKLKRLAREAKGNARAGTPADAARDADALLLAVHEVFFGVFEARRRTNRPSMVYCGDDEGAKSVAATQQAASYGARSQSSQVDLWVK